MLKLEDISKGQRKRGVILIEKNQIKKIIQWLMIGLLVSFSAHYLLELFHFNFNFSHVWQEITQARPQLFLYGTVLIFVLYTFFSSLFGSAVMGGMVVLFLSWFGGISTNLKAAVRAEPVYPNDIYWLNEMGFLFEMVGKRNTIYIITGLVLALILLFAAWRYRSKNKKQTKRKNNWIIRLIGGTLSAGLLIYIGHFNYPDNAVNKVYSQEADWVGWNQGKNYSKNGFIAGFLFNLDAPPMEPLDHYSKEAVEKLYEKYRAKADQINEDQEAAEEETNVIFIMNESFSDPSNLEGVESNQDPLVNYREIIQESISGNALAPGFGGGTATNEFQVLTGLSLEPLYPHINSPFIQLTQKIDSYPSIVKKMDQFGYKTTAIHPYVSHFYKRKEVYEKLNFSQALYQDNLSHNGSVSESHPYISDLSAYQELFDVMSGTAEKDFIHLVTMQNHGSYADKYEQVDYDVKGTGNPEEANAYFQDLEHSDEALSYLIEEINNYSEPVLLVFWGDHLPGFYQGEALENNPELKFYEAPFFIYSNDQTLEEEVRETSLIYFTNYVTQLLDFQISPYDALLLELEERLPVLDARIYHERMEKETVSSRKELTPRASEVLEDYTLLLYDITTGKQYFQDLGFLEP